MRPIFPFLMAGLSACAPQYVDRIAASPQDLPVRRAVFDSAQTLHDAFRMGCAAPGDVFLQVTPQVAQCRILPSPELAAMLLIEYDGALEIPALVMQTETRSRDGQHEVALSYFAELVQKSGQPRRIYFRRRALDRTIDDLLQAAGGRIEG